jgi:hypothetical protein
MSETVEKRYANLRALLALRGYALIRLCADGKDGPLMVARWDRSRQVPDLDGAESFMHAVYGTKPAPLFGALVRNDSPGQ